MNLNTPIVIGARDGWGDTYPFGISAADHCHHIYIIGKTGSGKTTLLRNMLIQHIALGQGFRKSLELFNLDRAVKEPPEKPLVIVEGFFGAMTLYQHGHRKVVALMGSTMSAAQEELIRKYTNAQSQVIVMLDEDDAGRTGREDIAVRLARFLFVKVHAFAEEGRQPEQLSAEEVSETCGGGQ